VVRYIDHRASFFTLYISVLVALLFLFEGCSDVRQIVSYTSFRQQLEKGKIASITVSGNRISGRFKRPRAAGKAAKAPVGIYGLPQSPEEPSPLAYENSAQGPDFVTYLPSFGDPGLWALLEKQKVEVNTRPNSNDGWSGWGPFLLLFMIFIIGSMLIRRWLMGRSDALAPRETDNVREYRQKGNRTRFSDVAGSETAKAELQEVVEFLKNPERFNRFGGRVPKGALLVGPPGTGKTLLARAVAGEAEVPFFSISGSDFMEKYVGVGASRVRSMFRRAKAKAPSIIFIDELDSIGGRRDLGYGGGHNEREQTLNQLLTEMDGFEANESVIVMAATNRPDILDQAILRPGRFDRHINVDLPTFEDRLAILILHSRNKPLADHIDLRTIARSTPGFSGADLENLLNEAAILAARNEKSSIEDGDIQKARDRIVLGQERRNLHIGEQEMKYLAYHEGGHALVAALLPNTEPLYKVTIIPRGQAMGVTQQLPEERFIYGKDYITARLTVMLGGRAAEFLVFKNSTSGAEQDLKQAAGLARKMVLDWGMSDSLSNLALGGQRMQYLEGLANKPDYSEATAFKVDKEVNNFIVAAFQRATELLRSHRDCLDRLAALLIEKEEVQGSEVMELVKKYEKNRSPDRSAIPVPETTVYRQ